MFDFWLIVSAVVFLFFVASTLASVLGFALARWVWGKLPKKQ
jgi:hypothetical protein